MTDLHVNEQQARGGHESPAPRATPKPYQGVVVTIGDILVTPDSVLVPQGRFPLAGTTWTVQDSTRIEKTTPRYARRLAAATGVTGVGLLFLLVKERHYGGFVLVTVVGQGLYHSVKFPPGPESTAHVAELVNEARALAAATVEPEISPAKPTE